MEILTAEAKAKISKLPLVLRTAAKMLEDSLLSVIVGNCDEDQVANMVCTADANARGRYSDEELMTYDEAQRALKISDRNKLKPTMDKYGIQQVIMTNHKVGFPREAVLALKTKLKKEEAKKW